MTDNSDLLCAMYEELYAALAESTHLKITTEIEEDENESLLCMFILETFSKTFYVISKNEFFDDDQINNFSTDFSESLEYMVNHESSIGEFQKLFEHYSLILLDEKAVNDRNDVISKDDLH